MAANTLNILRPSVNNLTTRVFVRAAGLDFEENDVWGKKDESDFVRKDPAQLTPMLEEEADIRLAATLEFLHAIDYDFPAWATEYMAAVEAALGDAYAEPAADVRGFVAGAKSQTG